MTEQIKADICNYVKALGAVTARRLLAEFKSRYAWITSEELKQIVIELSRNKNLVEVELIYKDRTNESIFCPKGTKVRK